MGFFDFIKDIGINPQKGEDNLEASLRDAVAKAQLGIQNFQLEIKQGAVYLSGIAATAKDAELARLIVGNHKGVEKVNDDGLKLAPPVTSPAPAAAPQAKAAGTGTTNAIPYAPAEMVTVKSGDTLSKIAKQYLGETSRYQEIFEANKPMLKDPDEIFPGQVLRIPRSLMSHASQPGV